MERTIPWILLVVLSFNAYKSGAQQKNINQQNINTMRTADLETKENTLTQQERNYAIKFLKETQQGVFEAVKDLSEARLKFKPATDQWSVEECVKHIAAAEKNLWTMAEELLKQPANGEKRAEIKMTDEQLVNAVEDRSHKSKTFAALEPVNSPYQSATEALTSFKNNREKLVAFVEDNQQDLRKHVLVLPIGTYDAYQFILLISAHSNRHTQQVQEIKESISFPKN